MQIWGVLTDLVGFYISSFVIFKRRGSTALLQSFSSFFTLEKNTDLTPDNPQMTLRMQMREWKSFYSNSFTFSDQNILKNWAFCCHIPKMTEANNNNNKKLLDQFLDYLYCSVNVTHPDPHYQNTELWAEPDSSGPRMTYIQIKTTREMCTDVPFNVFKSPHSWLWECTTERVCWSQRLRADAGTGFSQVDNRHTGKKNSSLV